MVLATGAGVLIGCDSGTGPENGAAPAIRTDRAEYIVQGTASGWRAEIPYTFTNLTGETVYVPNCAGVVPLRLDRWQDWTWDPEWEPMLPLCLSVPIPIESGGTVQDTVHFSAGYSRMPAGTVEGTYRIVWTSALRDFTPEAGGHVIALRDRTSNAFRLRIGP